MATLAFAEDTKTNHLVSIVLPVSHGEQAPDFQHILEESGWKIFENVGNPDYFVLASRVADTTTDKELFAVATFTEGDLNIRWFETSAAHISAISTEVAFQNEMSK